MLKMFGPITIRIILIMAVFYLCANALRKKFPSRHLSLCRLPWNKAIRSASSPITISISAGKSSICRDRRTPCGRRFGRASNGAHFFYELWSASRVKPPATGPSPSPSTAVPERLLCGFTSARRGRGGRSSERMAWHYRQSIPWLSTTIRGSPLRTSFSSIRSAPGTAGSLPGATRLNSLL